MRWLVFVSYLLSSAANTRIYSRADMNLWQIESRQVIKNFVVNYEAAVTDFKKWGPAAFASHFKELNSEEKKWLIRELNKYDELPTIKLSDEKLQFYDHKALVAELPLKEISEGIFKFPEKSYRYNFNLNLIDNYKSWKGKKSDYSQLLNLLFIPHAEAKMGKGIMAALLGVVGAIIGFLIGRKKSSSMAAIPEAAGAGDVGAHAAGGVGGGGVSGGDGGTTTGGDGGATTGAEPGSGAATATGSDAGASPSGNASTANIGVNDFPAAGEDLLQGCPDFIDPLKSSQGQIDSIKDEYTKKMYQLMRNFNEGGTYNAGVSTSSINPSLIQTLVHGKADVPENMCSQLSQILYLTYLQDTHPTTDLSHLYPKAGETDGIGPWGYWNANGPGTASYFHQAQVGTNTALASKAHIGSFLKIFWNHDDGPGLGNIPMSQGGEGHSVVFLGCKKDASGNPTEICTWGSHMKGNDETRKDEYGKQGVGVRCYPKSRLGLLVFSTPNGAVPGSESLKQDPFLVDLHKNTVRGRDNVMNRLQPQAI